MLPSTVFAGIEPRLLRQEADADARPRGNASPVKSRSSPAMIRSRLLLPAPLAPSTPIFAPGRNASQMSLSTTLSGGWTLESPFIV